METTLFNNIRDAMAKANVGLLRAIATDYGLDVDELLNRYVPGVSKIQEEPKETKPKKPKGAPKKPKADEPKVPCCVINAKRKPCKRFALPGCDKCKLHQKLAAEPHQKKPEVEPTQPKRIPPPQQSASLQPESSVTSPLAEPVAEEHSLSKEDYENELDAMLEAAFDTEEI